MLSVQVPLKVLLVYVCGPMDCIAITGCVPMGVRLRFSFFCLCNFSKGNLYRVYESLLQKPLIMVNKMSGEQGMGRVFEHIRTAKAQIRLRIRDQDCAQDDFNLRILLMFEGTYLPDATHKKSTYMYDYIIK